MTFSFFRLQPQVQPTAKNKPDFLFLWCVIRQKSTMTLMALLTIMAAVDARAIKPRVFILPHGTKKVSVICLVRWHTLAYGEKVA